MVPGLTTKGLEIMGLFIRWNTREYLISRNKDSPI